MNGWVGGVGGRVSECGWDGQVMVSVSVNLVNSTELQRQGPPHTPYIAIISNSIITLMIGALKEEIHACMHVSESNLLKQPAYR